MQQRAGRKFASQPFDEFTGQDALLMRHGGEVPFRPVGVVKGNERRLAAHRQAHVVFLQVGVNRLAEHLDALPLFLGVGFGDAR